MKKRSVLFHILQFLILLLILFSGFFSYRSVREKTEAAVNHIKNDLVVSLEDQFALRLEYSSISPSFLNSLVLKDLKLYSKGESEPFLTLEKVKLSHNIFGFLFSGKTAVASVAVSGFHLDINMTRDEKFLSQINSGEGEGGGPPDLNSIFTRFVRIRNWDASVQSDKYTVKGHGNNLALRQLGGYLRINLKGSFEYEGQGAELPLESLSLDAIFKGTIQNDLSTLALDSDFRNIDTNLAVITDQRLNLTYSDDKFRITKIKDDKPYDITLQMSPEEIQLTLLADEFSPSRLISFKSSMEKINPWLETSLSGRGDFLFSRESSFMNYQYRGSAYLNNSELPFPVRVSMDIKGDDLHLISEELRLSTSNGSMNWKGQWVFINGFPEGSVYMRDLLVGNGNKMRGEMVLRNIDDYYSLHSRNLVLDNGHPAGDLKALIYREDSKYIFSLLAELNPLNNQRDKIILDGEIAMEGGIQIQSTFRISDMALESLTPLLPVTSIEGLLDFESGVQLQSDGVVSYSRKNLIVQMNNLRTFLPDYSKSLTLSGYYGNDTVDLYNLELIWDKNRLVASGRTRFLDDQISLESRLNLNNNKYEFNGLYRKGQFSLMGNHGVKVQLAGKADSGFLGIIESEQIPVSWNGQNFLASLNLRGRYDKDNWELFLNDSSLKWVNSEILNQPEVTMTAFVAPGTVNIFSLGFSDDISQLKGNGSFFYDFQNDIYNGNLFLSDNETGITRESYDGIAAFHDGSLSLTLQLNQVLLDRFSQLNMGGRVDSVISFEGALDSPLIEASVNAPDLEWNQNPFGVQGRVRLSTEKLEFYDLNIQRNNLYLSRGLGVFDFKDGGLVFTSALSNSDLDDDGEDPLSLIQTGFTVKAETGLSVDFKNFEVPHLNDFNGRFRIHPIKWNGMTTFASKTIEFDRQGSVFRGQLVEDPEQFVFYDSESYDVKALLKRDFPIAMQMEGNLTSDHVSVDINDLVIDLNVLNYVIPKDPALKNRYVVFREGSLMEGGIQIRGTMADPDFSGNLQSRDLMVLTPYTDARIEETKLEVGIKNDVVSTNEFFIPIGRGGLKAKGSMTMRGWGINDYNLDINAVGSPGTPIAYNAYGLNGTGAFTGKLKLHGDSSQGNFDGVIVLDELVGSIGDKTEREPRRKKKRKYPFRLNLTIETGKNVLFVLPNPQVELVRAIAEQGEVINLTVDSLNKTMSMTGGVKIRSGEIYYFDRTFLMTEGSLSFNEDQDTFNPFLNIEAEIDTTDANGDNVTIYLVYRNPVRDEFTPSLRSNPSMPEDQITALFGQSLIPYDDTGEADISRLILATGGMVSQYGFVRPLEQALKDSMNLDNVTIRTEILENALLDQLNRESTVTDTGTTFSMAKYLDNTSLYLGKFAGDSLFFSAGVVVDYDQLYGLKSYINGISLVPDLTVEMRTPFFLVFWNYNKRNAFDFHNTDFVKNNAIGFEWQYSY